MGTCHLANFASRSGARATYEEVDCKLKHRTETVYVGKYRARPPTPPTRRPTESAGARAAYQTCDTKTSTYVGGPWRTARLWIGVTQPTRAAWTGGARWFRCEVLDQQFGRGRRRPGAAGRHACKDALKDRLVRLLLTCYGVLLDNEGEIGTMPAASCSAKHNAEFVGVWYAEATGYPDARTRTGTRSTTAAAS